MGSDRAVLTGALDAASSDCYSAYFKCGCPEKPILGSHRTESSRKSSVWVLVPGPPWFSCSPWGCCRALSAAPAVVCRTLPSSWCPVCLMLKFQCHGLKLQPWPCPAAVLRAGGREGSSRGCSGDLRPGFTLTSLPAMAEQN